MDTINHLHASIINVTETNEHFRSLVKVHKSLDMKNYSLHNYLFEINYNSLLEANSQVSGMCCTTYKLMPRLLLLMFDYIHFFRQSLLFTLDLCINIAHKVYTHVLHPLCIFV